MRYFFLLLIVTVFTVNTAEARKGIPVPVCFPCENIALAEDLPDTDDFKDDSGSYFDVGYMYEEYSVLWIPAWNTSGQHVLTNAARDTYYEIDNELKTQLESEGVNLSGHPLSIWKKIGGKIIWGILLFLIIWGMIPSKDDE